jgi:hypothetical protein
MHPRTLAFLAVGTLFAHASNAADTALSHICGDARLSDADQTDCRAQMDRAKTDAERARIEETFNSRIVGTDHDRTGRAKPAPSKTSDENSPVTAPAPAPRDSYSPAATEPPAYPGQAPLPKPTKPPA